MLVRPARRAVGRSRDRPSHQRFSGL